LAVSRAGTKKIVITFSSATALIRRRLAAPLLVLTRPSGPLAHRNEVARTRVFPIDEKEGEQPEQGGPQLFSILPTP
jgi:hypothetical protein